MDEKQTRQTDSNLRALREEAQVSLEDLANEIRVSVKKLRAWEDGTRRVPKHRDERIRWILALENQDRVIREMGIPKCAWVESWEEEVPTHEGPFDQHAQRLSEHSRTCSVCAKWNAAFEQQQMTLPPFPRESPWQRFTAPIMALFEPGFSGLVGLLGITVVILGIGQLPQWDGYLFLLYPLSLLLMGIVGLNVYRVALHPFPKNAITRWLARCVAGVLSMWSFVGTYMVSGYTDIFEREGQSIGWGEALGIATIMGLAYATLWFLGHAFDRT